LERGIFRLDFGFGVFRLDACLFALASASVATFSASSLSCSSSFFRRISASLELRGRADDCSLLVVETGLVPETGACWLAEVDASSGVTSLILGVGMGCSTWLTRLLE
jgi:hypothetical protein